RPRIARRVPRSRRATSSSRSTWDPRASCSRSGSRLRLQRSASAGRRAPKRPPRPGAYRTRAARSPSSPFVTADRQGPIPMHVEPTDEQGLVQRTARDVAERTLLPRAAERDASGAFPADELRELGKLGLLAIAIPEALGGAEAGIVAYSLA